ncbi:50S ribosome-binding GTPase [bacterium]|nr:50S ribosome-binding GTPase [bacterium]RQV97433.1 MAG: TGS domain-containing protein [bacterium]
MMPANLPPDYYAAERRYRETGNVQEKIEILREMLAIMPKHKGTEHLQGDLKRKIAKLQSQSQKKQVRGSGPNLDHIPREGAGQVVLVGMPNSGKSSMLMKLTHAHSEAADYPFSTFKPVPGMMSFEDIQIQLIDLPPVSERYTESWVFNIIRLADLVLLLVDLSTDQFENHLSETIARLEDHKISLRREGENKPQGTIAHKSTLLVGTKTDNPLSLNNVENFRSIDRVDFPVCTFSIHDPQKVNALKEAIFKGLRIIRIYTKTPGEKIKYDQPYVLPLGTTVFQGAMVIHKELAEKMKYARLWGSDKYHGQRVERDYVIQDRDIIEIHT